MISNVCYICGTGETYSNGGCRKGCRTNEIFLNGECVCAKNYLKDRDLCKKACAPFAVRDLNGRCRCIAGYTI